MFNEMKKMVFSAHWGSIHASHLLLSVPKRDNGAPSPFLFSFFLYTGSFPLVDTLQGAAIYPHFKHLFS